MKKLLAALVALVAINASAYDVTNTVTIVSNIYNRISEEHWITNNIKNTHSNYYYTNNVYTVSNVTLLVSQTNVHTTATYDMGRSMLSIMSNDVNSAKASIRSTADEAAGSASRASSSASSASSSAASAQNTLNNVNTRGAEIINGMNAKQNWFDQNYGKMITNHNIYVAEDQVARAGVAQNAADIASLEGRVGDNIQQLTTRMGAAEGSISSLQGSVSGLGTRIGAAEGNITTLGTRIGTAEGNITSANGRIDRIESYFNADLTTYSTQVVYKCDSIPEWSFKFDSSVYTMSGGGKVFSLIDESRPSSIGQDRIVDLRWYPVGYNYGIQIDYYVDGSSGYKTLPDFYTFPDVFTVSRYTFRKHAEKFVPSAAGSNVVVRAVSLFGDSWNPKKSEGEMLAETIDGRTADLNRRVEALEDDDTDLPEAIGMYTRHRPSVTYSYYYTYGGNKLLYRVKVYTDKATVVSSSGTSTTYGYDFEVLYKDSSLGNMGEVSYVQKIIYPADPASNEIVTRLYRNGWSLYKLRGFTDDIHDLKGGASVGDRLVCYSNTLGYFVMQLDAVDSSQAKELQYYVSADFNVYDANGSKIGRVMRDTDWSALSNWVERVFQKK